MRILQNTLFVNSPEAYLALDGENIVVLKEEKEAARVPFLNLEGVITFGYTGASPALMGACAKRNIALSFLNPNGKFLARVTGEQRGNVLLRKNHYRVSEDEEKSLGLARRFIGAKLYNSRWVLERAARDHQLRLDSGRLRQVGSFLGNAAKQAESADSLERLRGLEGEAAALYFSVFGELILQQKEDFYFRGRNRRPPTDKVNALLSFAYSLLAHEVAAALETVGLDPYVGFLHTDKPGRVSLALDLMEELRAVMADRLVLTLINKRMVTADGFSQKENGAVLLEDETRKNLLTAWQNRKQEKIIHPFLQEKIPWGLVPYVQALLLARYLRGDLDGYPPFFWK